jgi:hypothetical protein
VEEHGEVLEEGGAEADEEAHDETGHLRARQEGREGGHKLI